MPESSFLDRLYIASPCDAKWDDMSGDECERMCALCSTNVYNISEMTGAEARRSLRSRGTSVCMRFFRRKDGTIMTDDCPVGLRKVRNGFRKVGGAIAAVCGLLLVVPMAFNGIGRDKLWGSQKDLTVDLISALRNLSGKEVACAADAGAFNVGKARIIDSTNFGLPTYEQLTTGRFHLSSDEVYERDGEIFARISGRSDPAAKIAHSANLIVVRLEKAMTANQALEKAQASEKSKQYKTAEIFYKITLRYMETYKACGADFDARAISGYDNFLIACGRVDDSIAFHNELKRKTAQ